MMTRNPPELVAGSASITLDFAPSKAAHDKGDYEMLVDIPRKKKARILLRVPAGYQIPKDGVKLYELGEKKGEIVPSKKKKKAIKKLEAKKRKKRKKAFAKVFDGDLPGGFKLENRADGSAVLVDKSNSPGIYDYLVRIVKPKGRNTFADPGVRNR